MVRWVKPPSVDESARGKSEGRLLGRVGQSGFGPAGAETTDASASTEQWEYVVLRKSLILMMALALGGASASTAKAADLCFTYQNGGGIVAKGFRLPRKNKCAPFSGVQLGVTAPGAFSGVGCTSAAGDELILNYTLQDRNGGPAGYFEAGTCRIPVSLVPGSGVGGCSGTAISTPGGVAQHFVDVATIRFCNVDVPL